VFLRYNLFTIIWAVVIFLLILTPGEKMPELEDVFSFDKIAHTGVFCILAFLMIIGFSKQSRYPKLRAYPVGYSIMIAGVYASVLELGQAIIPGRDANLYDLAFNFLGVILGYSLFLIIYKFSFV
jgi:VanZ family protein